MVAQRGSPEPPEASARLDDLRRRLYRADATEADVHRYVAERGAAIGEPEPTVPPPPSAAPRLLRRRAILVAAGALVAVTALVVAVQQAEPLTGLPAASASPAPLQKQVQDIGEGQVLVVQDGAASPPVAAATSVRGVAAVGQRFVGRGNAVVRFDPPPGTRQRGRAMIVLTSSSSSPVAWRALRVVTRTDRTSAPVVMAQGRTQEPWGMAGPTTFVFATGPPTRIAVEATAGVRWTLLVAAANGVEPDPR